MRGTRVGKLGFPFLPALRAGIGIQCQRRMGDLGVQGASALMCPISVTADHLNTRYDNDLGTTDKRCKFSSKPLVTLLPMSLASFHSRGVTLLGRDRKVGAIYFHTFSLS